VLVADAVGCDAGAEVVGAVAGGALPAGGVTEAPGGGEVPDTDVDVEVGAVDVCADACMAPAMLHPEGPPLGAPACSHVVSVAMSAAPRRAFGGGGIGLVSLAIRSRAMLATVRVGSLLDGR
jgi:hypothetical protein